MLVDRLLEPSYISQCAVLYQTTLLGSYIQKKLKYEKKEKSVSAGKQFLIKIIDARKKNSQKQVLLGIIWELLNLLTSAWDWNIFLSMEVIEVKHLILYSSVSMALFCLCGNEASQTEERHSGDVQSYWNCKPAHESCIDCAFWGGLRKITPKMCKINHWLRNETHFWGQGHSCCSCSLFLLFFWKLPCRACWTKRKKKKIIWVLDSFKVSCRAQVRNVQA